MSNEEAERPGEPSPGTWPLRVEVLYEEQGPELVCDAWVNRVIVTGRIVTEQCRQEFHGRNLEELWDEVAEHIKKAKHVPNPFGNAEAAQ